MSKVIVLEGLQILHVTELCTGTVGPTIFLDALCGGCDHCGAEVRSNDRDVRLACLLIAVHELAKDDVGYYAGSARVVENDTL